MRGNRVVRIIIELSLVIAAVLSSAQLASAAIASVRVVDPYWRPLPGASVALLPTSDCSEPPVIRDRSVVSTNSDGFVELEFPEGKDAWLVVEHPGGFEVSRQCVSIGRGVSPLERIYLHARLRLDPTQGVEVAELSSENRKTKGRLGDAAFAGVYLDPLSNTYVVSFQGLGRPISVEFPGGRQCYFTRRSETTFIGDCGSITFAVERHVVTSLVLSPKLLRATKARAG